MSIANLLAWFFHYMHVLFKLLLICTIYVCDIATINNRRLKQSDFVTLSQQQNIPHEHYPTIFYPTYGMCVWMCIYVYACVYTYVYVIPCVCPYICIYVKIYFRYRKLWAVFSTWCCHRCHYFFCHSDIYWNYSNPS